MAMRMDQGPVWGARHMARHRAGVRARQRTGFRQHLGLVLAFGLAYVPVMAGISALLLGLAPQVVHAAETGVRRMARWIMGRIRHPSHSAHRDFRPVPGR